MLRLEDCKPGVEVIAIKHGDYDEEMPVLEIGAVYTINNLHLLGYSSNGKSYKNVPAISLNEFLFIWVYDLWQFKLKNKDELTDIFLTTSLNDEGPLRKILEEV